MTSKEFMRRATNGELPKYKAVSSVSWDPSNQTVYSYGSHFPLLFKAGSEWIRNMAGYSNTTRRHQHWAGSFSQYDIELPRGFNDTSDLARLFEIAGKNVEKYAKEASELKRKGTKKEEYLLSMIEKYQATQKYIATLI